jgi:hypothetical protein
MVDVVATKINSIIEYNVAVYSKPNIGQYLLLIFIINKFDKNIKKNEFSTIILKCKPVLSPSWLKVSVKTLKWYSTSVSFLMNLQFAVSKY